jgi:CMP-N,N'-diacetyllegionaminic acid synthase
MPTEQKVLAIIPARGGSKGIPLKNLRLVAGKSLLERTIELALSIPQITHVCVSTDHPEIKAQSETFDGVIAVDRPAELSGDRVADTPVLQHAVEHVEATLGLVFDIVLMLQVTSPLRDETDISGCLDRINNGNADAAWTVSPTELHYHPLKQLVVDENSNLTLFDDQGLAIVARQELTPVYHRNGCCYALRRNFLMNTQTLWSPNATQAVISQGIRVNIDTEEDLAMAEKLLTERTEGS